MDAIAVVSHGFSCLFEITPSNLVYNQNSKLIHRELLPCPRPGSLLQGPVAWLLLSSFLFYFLPLQLVVALLPSRIRKKEERQSKGQEWSYSTDAAVLWLWALLMQQRHSDWLFLLGGTSMGPCWRPPFWSSPGTSSALPPLTGHRVVHPSVQSHHHSRQSS